MGYVYIIHAQGTSFYKIGYSARPRTRLTDLQCGCMYPLRIAATFRGSRTFESMVWKQALVCGAARMTGEWFNISTSQLETLYEWMRANATEARPPGTAPQRNNVPFVRDRLLLGQRINEYLNVGRSMEEVAAELNIHPRTAYDASLLARRIGSTDNLNRIVSERRAMGLRTNYASIRNGLRLTR